MVLNVTVKCLASYESKIPVPDGLTLDEAIKYAKEHIENIPHGYLEYVPGEDSLIEEECYPCYGPDEG